MQFKEEDARLMESLMNHGGWKRLWEILQEEKSELWAKVIENLWNIDEKTKKLADKYKSIDLVLHKPKQILQKVLLKGKNANMLQSDI